MVVAYPRDLIGYGPNTPDPDWPDGARIAVKLVVDYEEGGENCILFGAAAWPGRRHMNGADL